MESKYKKIWDTDKDAYMRRYRKSPESRDFDGDIKLYLDHIDEIRGEESTINLDFLHIDQQPIKAVCRNASLTLCLLLSAHCAWCTMTVTHGFAQTRLCCYARMRRLCDGLL